MSCCFVIYRYLISSVNFMTAAFCCVNFLGWRGVWCLNFGELKGLYCFEDITFLLSSSGATAPSGPWSPLSGRF